MKIQINHMAQILQKNNLRELIPKASKKKSGYQAHKNGNTHALVGVYSSNDTWIVDSIASHHMEKKGYSIFCNFKHKTSYLHGG
jgi:penicillin-binding protein-related factor A (putative recombinase)